MQPGAGYRTRTGTTERPRDFKSLVSTIPPIRRMVGLTGLEPMTHGLKVRCSTAELKAHGKRAEDLSPAPIHGGVTNELYPNRYDNII